MYFEQLDIDFVLFKDAPVPVDVAVDVETTPLNAALQKKTQKDAEKFERANKTAKFYMLNHMTNNLFDLFMNIKSAKAIWEILDKKYGSDDAGKKKYVVGKWLAFHMVGDKPIMEQVHVYENLCTDVINEGMSLDEIFMPTVFLKSSLLPKIVT